MIRMMRGAYKSASQNGGKKKRGVFRAVVLRVMLAVMIVFGLSTYPAPPAYAVETFSISSFIVSVKRKLTDAQGYKDVVSALQTIVGIIDNVLYLVTSSFNYLMDMISTQTAALLGIKKIQTIVKGELTDIERNTNAFTTFTAETLRIIGDDLDPNVTHTCRRMVLQQSAISMETFQDETVREIVEAWVMEGRGVGSDPEGPRGTRLAMNLRCRNKYGNPIDGYPAQCVDSKSEVGSFKRTFIDADILPSTMDGAVTLEHPLKVKIEYDGLDASVLSPQNDNQKMWIAAMNYCLQLPGPKPTAPAGPDMLTSSVLMDAEAQYHTAISRGTQVVAQCSQVLSYYQRPNEEMGAWDDSIKACKQAIGTAGKTNYLDEATMKEKFDNCKKGQSTYQLDYLKNISCKSTQYFMLSANTGSVSKEMLEQAVRCASGWNKWQVSMARLNGNLVSAVEGAMSVRKDFNRVQRIMSGGQ
ncbi:MAG: hypothetical protein AB7E52_04660 [Bdellovibrionales bacterium]